MIGTKLYSIFPEPRNKAYCWQKLPYSVVKSYLDARSSQIDVNCYRILSWIVLGLGSKGKNEDAKINYRMID